MVILWFELKLIYSSNHRIHEIVKEKNKVPYPTLTTEEKELIENMLVCSLVSEEEMMITYYEDGYLLSSYMTVVDIEPSNSAVVCTDAFYNKMKLQFSHIIDVK
ncbi:MULTISPECIES: YolD-like family protein [Bacillus]|uniref:YolD-like family protein n=1 Tax=Bacillus TaxID=1386 RepID=UPI000BF11625|nr:MULTISPECIES: YolD-like family protein [Bacillus cereus group]MBJ8044271.1 YolD-like family protein [Bacillus cereus group sp. N17]PEJ00644.1 3-oxoacyl-ACP synthase [Bacillus toyonensis]PFZ67548.1 3-oxoacyl-ACP synthase [Bacillus toyonensis]HDR3908610.1 YolD-like family protein [Bacillus toyonensis]HDR7409218.1 YolD-like family protein [Bacillus toyonensis]